jgi:hypothetical protein
MSECAADGCGKHVPKGMLMCKPHWFVVSKSTRDEVWLTWRVLEREKSPETIAAYREARDKAIDEVSLAQARYDMSGVKEPGYE